MLTLYVIYDHPRDCPNHWVVRRNFVITENGVVKTRTAAFACAFDTLDEARAAMPHGTYNLGNEMETDPVIAEVWI